MQSTDVFGFAGSCQAISNLYLTGQVVAISLVIVVGNLLCQCLQGCFYRILVLHVNAAVVGGQDYAGAFCCLVDNGIARLVVANLIACTLMTVDEGFPTAVISNLDVLSSLLQINETGFSLCFATIECQAFCGNCRSLSHSQQGHT